MLKIVPSGAPGAEAGFFDEGLGRTLRQGSPWAEVSKDVAGETLYGAPAEQAIEEAAKAKFLAKIPVQYRNAATFLEAAKAGEAAVAAAQPPMYQSWGPAAALGAGAAYLGGAFKGKEDEPPPDESDLTFMHKMGKSAQERLAEDRERIARGEKPKYYLPPQAVDPLQHLRPEDYEYLNYYAADGGLATYPRRENLVEGPGTERSDDIPAMLSDGEFVINSRAVRGADPTGGGNRYAGAKNLYNMMRNFEMRA
tara:strand:- start:1194 stop:1952 length:759 start_codon:yes stop_codon:yes gene_type:complete